jgi:hypothetical protein
MGHSTGNDNPVVGSQKCGNAANGGIHLSKQVECTCICYHQMEMYRVGQCSFSTVKGTLVDHSLLKFIQSCEFKDKCLPLLRNMTKLLLEKTPITYHQSRLTH